MTGRAQRGGQGQSASNNSNANRQNEYFVPRDGIDREVITADICRYLGNDALVRPGTYQDDNGRTIQGYYITAYRNLTTAMIADLKNDSARWDQERRRHHSGAVRYADSAIRDVGARSQTALGYGAAASREHDENIRYPGSDAPGYSAAMPASGGVYGQQYPPATAGYAASYGATQPLGYSTTAATDPRYAQTQLGNVSMATGYTTATPVAAGGASNAWGSVGHYEVQGQNQEYSRDTPMTDATSSYLRGAQGQATPYTTGATRQPYSATTVTQPGYYTSTPATAGTGPSHPQDVFFGRQPASVASSTTMGYGSASPDHHQYEQHSTSRSGMATSNTQTQTSSSANSNRHERAERGDRGDRDRPDRDARDRRHDRDERSSRKHHYSSGGR